MKTRLSKPLSFRAKSFKSAGFESSCEAGVGRLVSAAKAGAADANDRTTARLTLEKRDIIFSLLGCSCCLFFGKRVSVERSAPSRSAETGTSWNRSRIASTHRSVVCELFRSPTDFVTIALKHNLVTIALKHFSARGALGSKNTPGWLTEESVLAVFRC
jgi:hypothetical protein